MSVKTSQTGARVLRTLEAVANHQPIGVRALARIMGEDKSAIHRAVVTLAEEGWLRQTLAQPVRWEVSARILAVADKAHGGLDLKQRARPVLDRLRDETGETAVLIVPKDNTLIVAELAESTKMLRVVLQAGMPVATGNITLEETASARVILPFLSPERQREMLGSEPSEKLLQACSLARQKGYAVHDRKSDPLQNSVAAPILDFDNTAIGAIAVIGPSERIPPDEVERFGCLAIAAAQSLSRGYVKPGSLEDADS